MREIETRRISLEPALISSLAPNSRYRPLYNWSNDGSGTDVIVWSETDRSTTFTYALACSPTLAGNIRIKHGDDGQTLVCDQQHFTHISLGDLEQGTMGYPTRLVDQNGLEIDPQHRFRDRRIYRPVFADPIFNSGDQSLALAVVKFDPTQSLFVLAKVVGYSGTASVVDRSLVDALLPSSH